MTIPKPLDAGLLRRKGTAHPPRRVLADEPRRKVGVRLNLSRYAAFKAFGARSGLTGEQVLVLALDRLLGCADRRSASGPANGEDTTT